MSLLFIIIIIISSSSGSSSSSTSTSTSTSSSSSSSSSSSTSSTSNLHTYFHYNCLFFFFSVFSSVDVYYMDSEVKLFLYFCLKGNSPCFGLAIQELSFDLRNCPLFQYPGWNCKWKSHNSKVKPRFMIIQGAQFRCFSFKKNLLEFLILKT